MNIEILLLIIIILIVDCIGWSLFFNRKLKARDHIIKIYEKENLELKQTITRLTEGWEDIQKSYNK